jgi:hypothetical protein
MHGIIQPGIHKGGSVVPSISPVDSCSPVENIKPLSFSAFLISSFAIIRSFTEKGCLSNFPDQG